MILARGTFCVVNDNAVKDITRCDVIINIFLHSVYEVLFKHQALNSFRDFPCLSQDSCVQRTQVRSKY